MVWQQNVKCPGGAVGEPGVPDLGKAGPRGSGEDSLAAVSSQEGPGT